MPTFAQIPKFTGRPYYHVTVNLSYLKPHIADWLNVDLCPLDLNPDFQRSYVWTKKQSTAFVEFILRGGQSGPILFNCDGWMTSWKGPFQIIDGKQRLHACLAFLDNELPAFGYKFKDYTDSLFSDCTLDFYVNNLKTRKEVLTWYLELNTGGTVHSKQDLQKVKYLLSQE